MHGRRSNLIPAFPDWPLLCSYRLDGRAPDVRRTSASIQTASTDKFRSARRESRTTGAMNPGAGSWCTYLSCGLVGPHASPYVRSRCQGYVPTARVSKSHYLYSLEDFRPIKGAAQHHTTRRHRQLPKWRGNALLADHSELLWESWVQSMSADMSRRSSWSAAMWPSGTVDGDPRSSAHQPGHPSETRDIHLCWLYWAPARKWTPT